MLYEAHGDKAKLEVAQIFRSYCRSGNSGLAKERHKIRESTRQMRGVRMS